MRVRDLDAQFFFATLEKGIGPGPAFKCSDLKKVLVGVIVEIDKPVLFFKRSAIGSDVVILRSRLDLALKPQWQDLGQQFASFTRQESVKRLAVRRPGLYRDLLLGQERSMIHFIVQE